MRINKFVAAASGMSRRAADTAIMNGRVRVNGAQPETGQQVGEGDTVTLDGAAIQTRATTTTIMLNKPAGYVCSRDGQGSKTVYELLPEELWHLKPAGRLDKESTGLLLMTDDGDLANRLTHPSYGKTKVYEATLDKYLGKIDFDRITTNGIELDDGPSRLGLDSIDNSYVHWRVTMREGRNRQIRRTFEAAGYRVKQLHRTHFGDHKLGSLPVGKFKKVGE